MVFDASYVCQHVEFSKTSDFDLIHTLLVSNMKFHVANLNFWALIVKLFSQVEEQFAALNASQNATKGDIQDITNNSKGLEYFKG